jgi:hypothetical protein
MCSLLDKVLDHLSAEPRRHMTQAIVAGFRPSCLDQGGYEAWKVRCICTCGGRGCAAVTTARWRMCER